MENEDWDPALVQLQRSFELRPTQVGLFNIGVCLKALHRYQEAIAAFERLLREFATGGSEERRTLASAEIRDMRALLGSVRITVSVRGAEVRIDGTVVGTSPIASPIEVVGGNHVVDARLDGYEQAEQRVAVVAGETATVSLTLTEPRVPAHAAEPSEGVEPQTGAARGGGPAAEPEGPGHGLRPVWFWSATAFTGVAAVTSGVLAALVVIGDAEYESSEPRTFDDQDAGEQMMIFADIALGVTVLAAAAAVVLYTQTDFRDGPAEDSAASTVLRPTLEIGLAHVAVGIAGGL